MKRIIITLVLLVVASSVFFIFRKDLNQSGEIHPQDFRLDHPEKISKIHFASNDKKAGFLTFTKGGDGIWWVTNGKKTYKADTSSLKDLLFYVLAKVEVKTPVNDASLERVNREMALGATMVQLYANNNLVKKFYVGSRTPDDLGTYMYLPGTSRPCVTQIPGHDGYLTPYFNTNLNNWRSPIILDIPASEISILRILWPNNPNMGFEIRKNGDDVSLHDANGKAIEVPRNRMLAYLDMFTGISRETGEPAGINKTSEKDSILNSKPLFEVQIQKTNGKWAGLKVYLRKISTETYSPENKIGELKAFETETYWGVETGTQEIWLMQEAILHKNMKTIVQLTSQPEAR